MLSSRIAPSLGFAIFFSSVLAAQATWHVDAAATGPGDGSPAAPFPTIQAGVDAAAAGDVVSVAPGEYVENVVVQLGIRVESKEGPTVTTLRAAEQGTAFLSNFDQCERRSVASGTSRHRAARWGLESPSAFPPWFVERWHPHRQRVGIGTAPPREFSSTACDRRPTASGIQEEGLRARSPRTRSYWGNATWGLLHTAASAASPSFRDCVRADEVLRLRRGTVSATFLHALMPELGHLGCVGGVVYGELQRLPAVGARLCAFELRPGRTTRGALHDEFDPAYARRTTRNLGFDPSRGSGASAGVRCDGFHVHRAQAITLPVTRGPAGGPRRDPRARAERGLRPRSSEGTLVPMPRRGAAAAPLDGGAGRAQAPRGRLARGPARAERRSSPQKKPGYRTPRGSVRLRGVDWPPVATTVRRESANPARSRHGARCAGTTTGKLSDVERALSGACRGRGQPTPAQAVSSAEPPVDRNGSVSPGAAAAGPSMTPQCSTTWLVRPAPGRPPPDARSARGCAPRAAGSSPLSAR
jgi:hypothetical protein